MAVAVEASEFAAVELEADGDLGAVMVEAPPAAPMPVAAAAEEGVVVGVEQQGQEQQPPPVVDGDFGGMDSSSVGNI